MHIIKVIKKQKNDKLRLKEEGALVRHYQCIWKKKMRTFPVTTAM